MDLLQRELQRKKQALAKAKEDVRSEGGVGTKRKKYMRQADLRRIEEEEEEARQLQMLEQEEKRKRQRISENSAEISQDRKKKKKKKKTKSRTAKGDSSIPPSSNAHADQSLAAPATEPSPPSANASTGNSVQEVTHQLRLLGLPIRYFGETLDERFQRLQQALREQQKTLQGLSEKDEFRLGQGHGIRNPFLERDNENDASRTKKKKPKSEETPKDADDSKDASTIDPKDGTSGDDPAKQIYQYFKGLLNEWQQDLEGRSEGAAQSVAGRNESKTLKQCKDYIRPLFRLLKRRQLEPGMQTNLFQMVQYCLKGEFVKAHDTYLDVAIGRAAWPIGVTMVGIHARTGRAKIESSNVAHVMNSELQRKYLTSVKRLLSYAQKKRPDVDPSKKVG